MRTRALSDQLGGFQKNVASARVRAGILESALPWEHTRFSVADRAPEAR